MDQGHSLYLTAFEHLSTCRPLGFGGAGPIPWLAVKEWCDHYQLDAEQREDVHFIVSRMDRAFLKYSSEKAEKK